MKFVMGTGYTSASTIGRKPATLAEMRDCIKTVRALLAGESVDFAGTPGRLGYAAKRRIPVIMAASGPKAIEVAGEVADGVLLLVGFNRGIVETALGYLERGVKKSGRRLEDLEIMWAVRTGTAADHRRGAAGTRGPTVVHWGILRWGGYWVEPAGLKIPKLEIPDAVHRIYPDLSHAPDWEAAIAATSFVPDEVVAQLCDAYGLIGTPDDCAARIAEMTKLGVRNLYIMALETFALPDAGGRRVPRRRVPASARGLACAAEPSQEKIMSQSTTNEHGKRADALIARMKEARGYIYPEWEFAARQDPEFVETYNRIYELGLGEGKHVSAKVREFVAIALLAFRGGEKAGLVAHMRRAIRLGATREEIFEILETCMVPGGAPTLPSRPQRAHRARRRGPK